jgi:DNA invertase Pin-like site-specific DNA recombinase
MTKLKITPQLIKNIKAFKAIGFTTIEICSVFKINLETYYRILKFDHRTE